MTTGPQNAVPFGKYLLLKRLAVGGMAELYLAKDPATDALVVIKRILPYLAQETEFVRMFLDEARIAAQLHHPHIIQMHELGHLEGSIFIAMEFVEGVDLRKILQQEQKRTSVVPTDVAAWLTARLCEGLHYAHNKGGGDGRPLGIIHRDISPQNLMVGYRGEVKLVDFGIAKATSFMERSKPGVIKGKFLYLSPEQLSQDRIDHRADLFAVGTMLYEVTTGKSPFYKPTTEAVIYAIRAEDPPPPHLTTNGYPAELSRIIMRCLLKDRSRRYQQAGEVHADLEAWMRKESPTTMNTVVDYVDKLFGDQEERTSIFIPPNARGERTTVEGTPRRRISGESLPTAPGLAPVPSRSNSNPTVPLGPFKNINEETTKPIAAALLEDHVPPSVGRRPTPASGSQTAPAGEDNRTQTVRPADIARAMGGRPNPSVITVPNAPPPRSPYAAGGKEITGNTAPLLQRPIEELEATAISSAGRLQTGDSLVELTPSAPSPAPSPATPSAPVTVAARRSRDVPQYSRPSPPVPSYLPEEPQTNGARPSNARMPVAQPAPASQTRAGPRPSDTFADSDDAVSYDASDEESTMDFRASSVPDLKPVRRDSRAVRAPEGILARKPWLIAVFAFLAVLILGLLLILWARPERKPVPASAPGESGAMPDEPPPEAPTELSDSGKTMVRFSAPQGTLITHDNTSFQPNKPYPLFPGSFTLMYRCPKKSRGKMPDVINTSVTVDSSRTDAQVIALSCK